MCHLKRVAITRVLLFVCFVTLFESCKSNTTSLSGAQQDSLVAIDFRDSSFRDLSSYVIDTVTQNGWAIRYFVKNDSLKYENLYLQCSKGQVQSVNLLEDYLEFNRDFIPRYVAETKDYLVFSGRCASDCESVMLFAKNKPHKFEYLNNVKSFDLNLLQVVHIRDSSYENEGKVFSFSLVDIPADKRYLRSFPYTCRGIFKPACIDTVVFGKESTVVKASLYYDLGSSRLIRETEVIKL